MSRNAVAPVMTLLAAAIVTSGCAGYVPVPGGTDTVNEAYYDGREDLLARLEQIRPGMQKDRVFEILGRKPDDLETLKRNEIITALLGTNNVEFKNSLDDPAGGHSLIHALYGYKLNYRVVEKEHGLSSPIRVRTDSSGFDYNVILVFYGRRLYERPILSGGIVNASNSKTIFDFLNPSHVLDRLGL